MTSLRDIKRRIAERREKLGCAVEVILPQLADMGALKVVLFGSLAEEQVDSSSDLDLLVIMPDRLPGKDWVNMIYSTVDRPVATDFLVFNQSELSAALPANSLLREILRSGRIVYERPQ